MKIPQLAKSLATLLALPVCGTALTAGAVSLDTVFARNSVVQQPSGLSQKVSTSIASGETSAAVAPQGFNLVAIDAQGNLNGRILASGSAMPSADVTLIRSGKVVANLKSDASGNFQAAAVKPGIYTVVVSGVGHYAVSGLNVLAHDSTAQYRKGSLEIGVSEASGRLVHELIGQRKSQTASADTSQVSSLLYGENGISREASAPRTLKVSNYRIAKSASGSFVGRLAIADQLQTSDASAITVYVLKNNDLVKMARTDKSGVFEIADLAAGQYTLIASKGENMLVAGFQLTDASRDAPIFTSIVRQDEAEPTPTPLTEESIETAESFEGMLAPEEDMEVVEELVEEEREESIVLEPINGPTLPSNDPYFNGGGYGGGGGFDGGGFNSGGGGFGGGGFGGSGNGLFPLIAAAGIAAVASTDDDNFYRAPRPISAFRQ